MELRGRGDAGHKGDKLAVSLMLGVGKQEKIAAARVVLLKAISHLRAPSGQTKNWPLSENGRDLAYGGRCVLLKRCGAGPEPLFGGFAPPPRTSLRAKSSEFPCAKARPESKLDGNTHKSAICSSLLLRCA
jgi:hypothetical protein